MREPHVEGVAIHDGPESGVVIREDGDEAKDRGTCGPGIEPRNHVLQCADAVIRSGRRCASDRHARDDVALRGRRPRARTEPLCAGTGRSSERPPGWPWWAALGSSSACSDLCGGAARPRVLRAVPTAIGLTAYVGEQPEPVAWTPAVMGNRDDDELLVELGRDQSVRKPFEEKAAWQRVRSSRRSQVLQQGSGGRR
jgi:hypothetical protein